MKKKTILLLKFAKKERMSKTVSNYIATFDYFDTTLLTLSAASGTVAIALLLLLLVYQ